MSNKNQSHRIEILIAVIALIGTLGAAIFSNWDKIFSPSTTVTHPKPPPEIKPNPTTPPVNKQNSPEIHSRINTGNDISFPGIGAKALAPFQENGCLYPGTVLTAEKNKSLVRFDFGQDAWITTDDIYLPRTPSPPELKLNADVFVRLDSGRVWALGQIKERWEGKHLVGINLNTTCRGDKTYEWATVEGILLRK
jgi:hypothetical protein